MTATYAKFTLQLNTVTDADVIEYLAAQDNMVDTIRRALRAQLREEKYRPSERGVILGHGVPPYLGCRS